MQYFVRFLFPDNAETEMGKVEIKQSFDGHLY